MEDFSDFIDDSFDSRIQGMKEDIFIRITHNLYTNNIDRKVLSNILSISERKLNKILSGKCDDLTMLLKLLNVIGLPILLGV